MTDDSRNSLLQIVVCNVGSRLKAFAHKWAATRDFRGALGERTRLNDVTIHRVATDEDKQQGQLAEA